jgi:rare lipoprotein A (peptidoglycan hydrolase)
MRRFLLSFGLPSAFMVFHLGSVDPAWAGTECGEAAYYDQGSVTATGEQFNPGALTAAHPWLPFGSRVTVVDQDTKLSVNVRINDRGPWTNDRILDMTPAVINVLDPKRTGDTRYVCIYWNS